MSIENIKKKTLKELLVYYEALTAVENRYTNEMIPMYGMATEFDKRSKTDIETIRKLEVVRGYMMAVLDAIEEKTFEGLDNDNIKEEKKVINTNTSTVQKTNKTPKKKENVQKTKKKTK